MPSVLRQNVYGTRRTQVACPDIIDPLALLGFVDTEGPDERQAIFRRTNHADSAGGGERLGRSRRVPQAQLLVTVILPLEGEVWRNGGVGSKTQPAHLYLK